MDDQEHRRFSRVPFDATSELIVAGAALPTHLLDISLKGALVARPEGSDPSIGSTADLAVALNGTDIVIRMRCEIAHVEDTRLGLRCVEIDVESIAHLRRLMELNIGDANAVQRELSALL